MTYQKIIFTFVPLLLLAATACGKLESTKKTTQPIVEPVRYTDDEFAGLCIRAGGRLAGSKAFCLTRVVKELPAGVPGSKFQIVPKFYAGQLIVADAENSGRVDIIYDGSFVIGVPGRIISPVGAGGELSFFINQGGYKNVSAAIWTCFDRVKVAGSDMRQVFCPANVVP